MNAFRSIAMLLCAVALTACEKNAVQDITGSLPGSRIKFFNFGVNTPAVNFYANDSKITAITSATGVEAVTGVNSGGVGSGGFYSAIQPGAYTFAGKISAVIDKDLVVSRATATLAATPRRGSACSTQSTSGTTIMPPPPRSMSCLIS